MKPGHLQNTEKVDSKDLAEVRHLYLFLVAKMNQKNLFNNSNLKM